MGTSFAISTYWNLLNERERRGPPVLPQQFQVELATTIATFVIIRGVGRFSLFGSFHREVALVIKLDIKINSYWTGKLSKKS